MWMLTCGRGEVSLYTGMASSVASFLLLHMASPSIGKEATEKTFGTISYAPMLIIDLS